MVQFVSDLLFVLQEAEIVTSMSFHPTGDFILVGTEHPTSEFFFFFSNPQSSVEVCLYANLLSIHKSDISCSPKFLVTQICPKLAKIEHFGCGSICGHC